MGKYAVHFMGFSTTTAPTTAVGLDANGTGEMGEVVEICMTGSGSAAAADRQHRCETTPCSFATAGTGTAATPEPFRQITQAALLTAATNYSAEATVMSNGPFPVLFGFNQRGGMRWAVPQGEGIWLSNATEESGLAVRVRSDAAGAVDGFIHFWEP